MPRTVIAKPRPKPKRTAKKSNGLPTARTYRAALNYLKSVANYEEMPRVSYTPNNFSLNRMTRLLSALGSPHRAAKTVHIAGTKGKGSTATMLARMLQNCGYKVGLYTSPHMTDVRERITINGAMISESAFARSVYEVSQAAQKRKLEPTYFEIVTAVGFLHFAKNKVDIAIIETGLGGRLDATNVIRPEVAGITSISYDHVQQLGSSLAEIAGEKAGIIKNGMTVISAPQPAEAKEALRRVAAEANADLRFAGEDIEFSFRFESSRPVGPHTRLCLTTPHSRFEHLHVPLLGEHQAVNCGLALCMVDALKSRGFAIEDQKAVEGLAGVSLPGRMEMISQEPRVMVDGAHNAASVDALMRAIGQNIPYDSMVVIFGCHKDKDVAGMVRHIQIGADKVIFTSTGSPKSVDPAELASRFSEHSTKMCQVASDLRGALRIARGAVSREDLICITGSFYLVGMAKRLFASK